MHHRMTEGLESGVRSKKGLQGTKAYQLHKSALQVKRTLQWCPQNELRQKSRPYKDKEYHDLLGDTFERKEVRSRQRRLMTHDGIIFSVS